MPRVNSTQPVAVQRAGSRPLETSIDASAFQFDDSEARAVAQVGSIMTELGKREIAARDSLAISQTAKMRQQAMLEMDQFKVDNPDSSTWKQGQIDINNKYRQEVNKLKMTDRARKQVDQESDSFAEVSAMTTQIQATSTAIDQDIATSGASAIQAIAGSGDDPGSEMAMATALAQHEQALLRKYPPEVAAAHMLATTNQGEKQKINVLVQAGEYEKARELTASSPSFLPSERSAQMKFITTEENRRKNKLLDAEVQRDRDFTTNAAVSIADGDLSIDTISQARITDDVAVKWEDWAVKASDYTPPTTSSYKSNKKALDAVLDPNLTNMEKYDVVLEQMYDKEGLSDNDYRWAIGKIENPYPKDMSMEINAISNDIESFYAKGIFNLFTGDEKTLATNTTDNLMNWIDIEIDAGRTPTGEDIYGKARTLTSASLAEAPKFMNIAHPKTKAQFDKIPSGTVYIEKDGSMKRKK